VDGPPLINGREEEAMVYFVTGHKVEDAAQWKAAFDTPEGAAMRKAMGMKSFQVLRRADDPTCIIVIVGFESADVAQKFVESEELKQAMEISGVTEMLKSIDTSWTLVEVEMGAV